jgi:hypothetical protein
MSIFDEVNTSILDELNTNILDEINTSILDEVENVDNYNITPIFPICFISGSKVLTDQGIIEIQNINKNIHTIRGKKILYLTKNKLLEGDKLVKIEKDALFKNCPNRTTVLTSNHKVFYNGDMVSPCEFVNKIKGVSFINYNNELLYNILLEKHGKMIVNNMIAETLGEENIISFIYMLNISDKEKFQIIKKLNNLIKEYKYDKEMYIKFYKKIYKKYKSIKI